MIIEFYNINRYKTVTQTVDKLITNDGLLANVYTLPDRKQT